MVQATGPDLGHPHDAGWVAGEPLIFRGSPPHPAEKKKKKRNKKKKGYRLMYLLSGTRRTNIF